MRGRYPFGTRLMLGALGLLVLNLLQSGYIEQQVATLSLAAALELARGTVLARYQDTGSPLLSGYLIGEKYLQGKAAALDVQLDAGHVVLIGFRPQWRGQPFGTFKVLFNAVLYNR